VNDIVLIYSTFADEESAKHVAKELVSAKLCACANIIPKITSIYEWQGEMCESCEVAVIFKTTEKKSKDLQLRLQKLHPYNLPAIARIQAKSTTQFFDWIASQTI